MRMVGLNRIESLQKQAVLASIYCGTEVTEIRDYALLTKKYILKTYTALELWE
jgi:hypothetical protein